MLKAGIPAGMLAGANIPLLLAFLLLQGCHKLVSDGHGPFLGHQFSIDIQLLKLPHFWKVTVTTAIWHFPDLSSVSVQAMEEDGATVRM
jgi:hypothetical protein